MTVSSTVNKAIFLGSGSAGPFTFGFKFFVNTEISIIKTDVNGVETLLYEGDHYVLTGAGLNTGGSVALTVALEADETIEIMRTLDLLQETSFVNQGAFYPELHEEAFDRVVMMIQQLYERILDIEARGYTFTINQAGSLPGTMTELTTAAGNVVVALPESGTVGAMKSGTDAYTVTFETTVVGQTLKEDIVLDTDGAYVWLALFDTQWRVIG